MTITTSGCEEANDEMETFSWEISSEFLHIFTIFTNIRSAHQGHYDVPHVASAIAGPKAWNSLPSELRCIAVDSTFRRRLKAELFSRAYGVSHDI